MRLKKYTQQPDDNPWRQFQYYGKVRCEHLRCELVRSIIVPSIYHGEFNTGKILFPFWGQPLGLRFAIDRLKHNGY